MEDADALSRAPHEQPSEDDITRVKESELHVNQVIKSMPVTTIFRKGEEANNRGQNITEGHRDNEERMAKHKT